MNERTLERNGWAHSTRIQTWGQFSSVHHSPNTFHNVCFLSIVFRMWFLSSASCVGSLVPSMLALGRSMGLVKNWVRWNSSEDVTGFTLLSYYYLGISFVMTHTSSWYHPTSLSKKATSMGPFAIWLSFSLWLHCFINYPASRSLV